MSKLLVVTLVMGLFLGYIFMVGEATINAETMQVRNSNPRVETRADVTNSYLSFTSLNALEKFYKDHEFGEGEITAGTWSIKAKIVKSSLHYSMNGKEYFVFYPFLYSENGETVQLAENANINIQNIPENVVIIITGFDGGSISVSNFKGELVLGAYTTITYQTKVTYLWVFSVGFDFNGGVSGLSNTEVTVDYVSNVVITDYVCDTDMSNPIYVSHVDNFIVSGVSIAAYTDTPYTVGIRMAHVNNFTIRNNAGLLLTPNSKGMSSIFGLEIRGYYTGLVMEYVNNFTISGIVDIGGWGQGKEKRSAGIIAYMVNETYYGTTKHLKKNGEGYISMWYNLFYNSTKVWRTINGTVDSSNITYKKTITGSYTKAIEVYKKTYMDYRVATKDVNLSLDAFSYYYTLTLTQQKVKRGLDLRDLDWWNDINNTPAQETIKIVQEDGYLGQSHKFTIYHNTSTGEYIYLTITNNYEDRNCRVTKSLINMENTTTITNKSVNNQNQTVIYYRHTLLYEWEGMVRFHGSLNMDIIDDISFDMEHLTYGLGVEDNGTAEKDLVEFINGTSNSSATLNDVEIPVGKYINAPKQYKYSVGISGFEFFSGLMSFLIAFAYVRWAYAYIKTPEPTPEEVARHKEMLRNILIGTVVVIFVLVNYAMLLNLFSWG